MQTKHTALGDMNTQKKTPTIVKRNLLESAVCVEGNDDTVTKKQIWECDICGVQVVLYVTPSTAPTHRCRKATNQTKQLSRKG